MNIFSYFEINNRRLELQIGTDRLSGSSQASGKVLAQITGTSGPCRDFSAADYG